MITSDQILSYVDERIDCILARPQMFASSPEGMEDVLITLDDLTQFVRSEGKQPKSHTSGYRAFLEARGFESASFCSRHRPGRRLEDDDMLLFSRLADFWQEYRKSSTTTRGTNATG